MHRFGIQILSYNRPNYLKKTLDSLMNVVDLDIDKIAIVEQSDKDNNQNLCIDICKNYNNIFVFPLFKNLGQRGATNYLAAIGFWTDCEYVMLSDHDNMFHVDIGIYSDYLKSNPNIWITTGYHSPEHDIENKSGDWLLKSTCRAGHICMRSSDFLKLIPIDEKQGNCSWYAGLDWSLTHWTPGTPGYTNQSFIACFPGGVEHIGRDSCWQGYYNDEIELSELVSIRTDNLYNIIKKYPPRHTYISEKYWYEQLSDAELYNVCGLGISNDILNSHSEDEVFTKLANQDIQTLAFNYLWPEYGFYFLEDSINCALKIADAYLIYINYYSFTNQLCSVEKCNNVINFLIDKYLDCPVYFIIDQDEKSEISDNNDIKYYFDKISNLVFKHNLSIKNLFLIQSDEIYDVQNITKFKDLLKFKNSTAYITNPICYIDTPYWQVVPAEKCDRISWLSLEYYSSINCNWSSIQPIKTNVSFIHLSYVLTNSDLKLKLQNWGHRKDISELNMETRFLDKLDELKTSKNILNLHPINPTLYDHLDYANSDLNNVLFLKYVTYLFKLFESNFGLNYSVSTNVDISDPVNFFPIEKFNQVLLKVILLNLIPMSSNVFICEDNSGLISQFVKQINSNLNVYSLYSKTDNQSYGKLINNSISSKFNIFYGDHKTLSLYDNNFFDLILFNFSNFNIFKLYFVEFWPKLKKYGFFSGLYLNTDPQFIVELSKLLSDHIEDCPWGKTQFNFYEKYVDLSLSINYFLNFDLTNLKYNLWITRKG